MLSCLKEYDSFVQDLSRENGWCKSLSKLDSNSALELLGKSERVPVRRVGQIVSGITRWPECPRRGSEIRGVHYDGTDFLKWES